jgi:hypothetical protein
MIFTYQKLTFHLLVSQRNFVSLEQNGTKLCLPLLSEDLGFVVGLQRFAAWRAISAEENGAVGCAINKSDDLFPLKLQFLLLPLA